MASVCGMCATIFAVVFVLASSNRDEAISLQVASALNNEYANMIVHSPNRPPGAGAPRKENANAFSSTDAVLRSSGLGAYGCVNVTGAWHQVGTVSGRITIVQTRCSVVAIGGWPQGPQRGSIDGNKFSMFGITAAVSGDRIQWTSGDVWARITYIDLTGIWRPAAAFGHNHELVKIMQTGLAVIATGDALQEPLEGFVKGAQVTLRDFSGSFGTTGTHASITWSNGAVWLRQDCVDLSGDWYSQSKAGDQIAIRQAACTLSANATWHAKQIEGQIQGTLVMMGSWIGHLLGQQTSTIAGNTIAWDDGSLWSKVPCSDLAGEWRPVHSLGLSDDRVNISQAGCNLTAAVGNLSRTLAHGTVVGTIVSMLGLVGTFADGVISWTNGVTWAKVSCQTMSGEWCAPLLNGTDSITVEQDDCGVEAVGGSSWSPALGFVSGRTVFMFGITGTLLGSETDAARRITWTNGVEWTSCALQVHRTSSSSGAGGTVPIGHTRTSAAVPSNGNMKPKQASQRVAAAEADPANVDRNPARRLRHVTTTVPAPANVNGNPKHGNNHAWNAAHTDHRLHP